MTKIINVVDKNNELVASISEGNVILHNDYKVITSNEDESCFCDKNGTIEVLSPEVTI